MNTRILFLIAAALGVLAVGQPGQARVRRVPESYATLQQALSACQEYDTVLVQPGVYPAVNLALGTRCSLFGLGQPGDVVLQGDGQARILRLQTSTKVRGIAFRDGHAASGGALYLATGDTQIEHCLFVGNSADLGGAVALEGSGSCQLQSCTFVRNQAPVAAAIFAGQYQAATLRNCLITHNEGGPPVEMTSSQRFPLLLDCDIAQNEGGDWVGWLQGQESFPGNFSQPARYCDPQEDLHLAADSPCLASHHESGSAVGALGQGCEQAGLDAAFRVLSPVSGGTPLRVEFIADPLGNPDRWEWDFEGDGTYVEGEAAIAHEYRREGVFQPRLRVWQGARQASSTQVARITARFDVRVEADSVKGPAPFTTTLRAVPVGRPATYRWEFGDGQVLVTADSVVTHEYLVHGSYTVLVMASDSLNMASAVLAGGITVTADTLRVPQDGTLAQALSWLHAGTVVLLDGGGHTMRAGPWDLPEGSILRAASPGSEAVIGAAANLGVLFRIAGSGRPVRFESLSFELATGNTVFESLGESSLELDHCQFAIEGGGMSYSGIARGRSSCLARSCRFDGICIPAGSEMSMLRLVDCRCDNTGAALSTTSGTVVELEDCWLSGSNYLHGRRASILRCSLVGNTMDLYSPLLTVTGDTLEMEEVVLRGAGLSDHLITLAAGSRLWMDGCLVTGNQNNDNVARALLSCEPGSHWSAQACVFWGNPGFRVTRPGGAQPDSLACTVMGRNLHPGWDEELESFFGESGNRVEDPQFCDPTAEVLGVRSTSCCLPANNECGRTLGGLGACLDDPLEAWFDASPTIGPAPLEVRFQEQARGDVARFQWDFTSDGSWDSEEPAPLHVYETDGPHSVTLRVSNGERANQVTREGLIHSNTPGLIRVPEDWPSVGAALAAAASGDTVEVACGHYHEHDLRLPDGIILRSSSGQPDCVTLDADSLGRVLVGDSLLQSVRVEGITLANGRALGAGAGGHGGAVRLMEADAVFSRCVFRDNAATQGGAGWVQVEDSLRFSSCTFVRNSATTASVWRTRNNPFQLDHCLVTDNSGSALFFGGAQLGCSDLWNNAAGNWTGSWADQLGVEGNIEADPLYCDVAGSDLRLRPDSPCLPPASACGAMGAMAAVCPLLEVGPAGRPAGLSLRGHPNPFNPSITLAFQLPRAEHARMGVFDLLGRQVEVLVDEDLPAGEHQVVFRAGSLASGIYVFWLRAGAEERTWKAVLMK